MKQHLAALLTAFVTIWLLSFTVVCGVCAGLKVFGII